jgi:hypothetical protein
MATEVRDCDRCHHTLEVVVTHGAGHGVVHDCPRGAENCGLTTRGENIQVVQIVDEQ